MIDSWLVQLRKGIAELSILAILQNGESYGYEILKDLENYPQLVMKESSIYLLLGRLNKAGLIAVRQIKSDKGPRRRYYRLTADGRQKYKDMRRHWIGTSKAMDQLIGNSNRQQRS